MAAEAECMVCLQSDRHVVSNYRLPLKYCDCSVTAHIGCWMRSLRAMEGRRFCLICDLEHWDRCWHREQNAAVRRVLITIGALYVIIGVIILMTSSKKS
jgi:hypothetical protein